MKAKAIAVMALSVSALGLSACGFQPLYATAVEENGKAIHRYIKVGQVRAPDSVHSYITDALQSRVALRAGETPRYELTVRAKEGAQRLAVQIDATVTRYNYRLSGGYTLVNLETGERFGGGARAVTSYNIVSSQYSTLFAEQDAKKKAAALFAEQIERDILLNLSDKKKRAEAEAKADMEDEEDPVMQFEDEFDETIEYIDDSPFESAPPVERDDGIDYIDDVLSDDGRP